MSEVNHTPGPWVRRTELGISAPSVKRINRAGRKVSIKVATLRWESIGKEELEANARLITAAPEMLEALLMAKEALGRNEAYDAVVAAIAKVEGKSK